MTTVAGDTEVRGMARGSGLNLIGAICAQGMLFVIMLVLARTLGVADVGRYAQCYAMLSLLGLLALSGLRAGLTRFVAVHLADADPAATRGTVRLGLAVSTVSGALAGAGLALAAPWVAALLHDGGLTTGLRLIGFALPAAAGCDAALAATRGWRTQRAYALIGQVYEPVARLTLTALALAAGWGLTGALWALVVASWSAAVLAGAALYRQLATVPAAKPTYHPRRLFGFSAVSWASSLSSTGLIWLDVLLLGAFGNPDVGVYNVATRLVTLAAFVLAPVNAAFAPSIAHLWQRGDQAGVRHSYAAATGWIVRLSLPAFVLLLVFPRDLLALFGPGYPAGAAVTVILAAGQLVNAATGPCGTVLNMSGNVRLNLFDNVGALLLNVALNLWLIPGYGITGAAIAWTASLVAVNLARLAQVYRLAAALPGTVGLAKGVAAGAVALAVALAVRELVPGGVAELVAGGVAVAAAYTGGVLLLGLSTEDKMVLRSLGRPR